MRFPAAYAKNRIVLIGVLALLFSCKDPTKKINNSLRLIHVRGNASHPAPKGFVLWVSQDASNMAMIVFKKDTNGDGRIDAKLGEHGEMIGDKPVVVWINTITNKKEEFDAFLGSDARNRMALLKKKENIFVINGLSGEKTLLKGTESKADLLNPCLGSREAVLDADGKRVVFPIGEKSYRSYELQNHTYVDVETQHLLWRVKPFGEGEEVFEVVTDRDGDGLHFPESLSTCACAWCPRFARSVGSYGSRGDEINKSVYYKGKRLPKSQENKCRRIGQTQAMFQLLECNGSLFRKNIQSGEKFPLSFRLKIPSYENPTLDGWYPLLALDEQGLRMARYSVEKNLLETGPHVKHYAKKTHIAGYWLGISAETKDPNRLFVWELSTKRTQVIEIDAKVTTLNALIVNTQDGKYMVNGFTGSTRKIHEQPTLTSANGCAFFRKQTHRLTKGPWEMLCVDAFPASDNPGQK